MNEDLDPSTYFTQDVSKLGPDEGPLSGISPPTQQAPDTQRTQSAEGPQGPESIGGMYFHDPNTIDTPGTANYLTKVSYFGGRSDYKTGQDSGKYAFGGRSYDPKTDTESNIPVIALPEPWYDKGIIKPGQQFYVYNPNDPDRRVLVTAGDKSTAGLQGAAYPKNRGADLFMPEDLKQHLGVETDQNIGMDLTDVMKGTAPMLTQGPAPGTTWDQETGDQIRKQIAQQPAQSRIAGDITADSVSQAMKAGPKYKNPDGSLNFGNGITYYQDSGIINVEAGGSVYQWRPGEDKPKISSVKPAGADYQIVSDTNTGQHYRVNKNTGQSELIKFPEASLGIPEGVSGDAALEGQSDEDKAVVKKIANYDLPLPTGFALKNPHWAKIMALTAAYDPSFDNTNYQTKMALRKQFTSGKYSQTRASLNTAVNHLAELQDAVDKLGNSDWQPYNTVANYIITQKGDPRVKNFLKASTAVESEMATVFKGTGATDQEIKQWRANLSSSDSPQQMHEGIGELLKLMAGRLDSLQFIYTSGLGKQSDFPMMSEKAKQILATKFGDEGKSLNAMDESGMPSMPASAQAPSSTTPSGTTIDVDGKSFIVDKVYTDTSTGGSRKFKGIDGNGKPIWEVQ